MEGFKKRRLPSNQIVIDDDHETVADRDELALPSLTFLSALFPTDSS